VNGLATPLPVNLVQNFLNFLKTFSDPNQLELRNGKMMRQYFFFQNKKRSFFTETFFVDFFLSKREIFGVWRQRGNDLSTLL